MTKFKRFHSKDTNKRITIYYDEDAESPREFDGNICSLICFRRRYTIGDKHEFKDPGEVKRSDYFDEDKYFRFPLHLLDHSGISIRIGSFGQGFEWDSGQVGWVFVPKHVDPACVNDGASHELSSGKAYEIASGEVSDYDTYLSGEAYGAVLEHYDKCECCGRGDWEHDDSCWGFFGTDAVMEFAKELGLTAEWEEEK